LSVVLAITFFELAIVENPRGQLETNKFVVLLLKLVGLFTPSATRVRKNRRAIRGVRTYTVYAIIFIGVETKPKNSRMNFKLKGHSKSSTMIPIEKAFVTSY